MIGIHASIDPLYAAVRKGARSMNQRSELREWALMAAIVAPFFVPAAAPAAPLLKSVLIRDVPFVRQKPDFCDEACAEMYLRKLKVAVDQDYVFDQSGLDPVLGRGCYTRELTKALKQIGFHTGGVWSEISVRKSREELDREFVGLHADLAAGIPSIVCMRYDEQPETTEHFRLVLGYDAETKEVIYHDPAEANGAYLRMSRARFLDLWPLKYSAATWTIVRLRLEPGKLPAAKSSTEFTAADFAQHMYKLRSKLPHEGFSIAIERPFVVIGDEVRETVQNRSRDTVQWAVERLKKEYFKKEPAEILDIWLFRDNTSYEENAEKLFKSKPTTPYGYFSSRDRALVMNISTGGGTLVHEIVHPFIASNFPDCPSWFNEGLASLYEQASERDGHIIGLTNWRLAGLQKALKKGTVPSFETLCGTTTHEFYDRDSGSNYAQARYLCYYLQERGLLTKYYHAFRKNADTDPTGYKTLLSILEEDDADAFRTRWEKFVQELRFRD
jgi:hypothetical protein